MTFLKSRLFLYLCMAALVIVILFLSQCNGELRSSLKTAENTIGNLNIQAQEFQVLLNKQGQKVASQEQVIISEQQARELLKTQLSIYKSEIGRLESIVSAGLAFRRDTIFIPYVDTVIVFIDSTGAEWLRVPLRFAVSDSLYDVAGTVLSSGVMLDSVKFREQISVVIGTEKRTGFQKVNPFHNPKPVVKLMTENSDVTSMWNVRVNNQQKEKRLGIMLYLGYGYGSSGHSPQVGVGLGYQLIGLR